jgi:Fe-S-cluster containining protein
VQELLVVSLCDTCRQPGACCRGFSLNRISDGDHLTLWDDEDPLKAVHPHIESEAPFHPVERLGQWTDAESGRTYSSWKWSCSALGEDGRCTMYDNRPDLCRRYEAGSSPLCVMYVPPDES